MSGASSLARSRMVPTRERGIPEDLRGLVFEPFVTTKASGTGLGLSLVAKIVEDHGGAVEVGGQPGRTAISVYLPVPPAPTGDGEP